MKLLKRRLRSTRYLLLAVISCVLVTATWVAIAALGSLPEYFLPSPTQILERGIQLWASSNYGRDVLVSVYRIMLGFGLAAVVGVPLGIALGLNKLVAAIFEPHVSFIRYMPVAGFIPLTILWVGIGDAQKIVIIFIGTFFQVVPMVMDAVADVPEDLLDTARTLGAKDGRLISLVIIPYAMPTIFDSLRIALGIAWTYLVVAEIVAAGAGIGFVIIRAQRYLQTPNIFVGILTVGVLGMLSDVIFKLWRRVLFRWKYVVDG